jgi:hypothetical protein
VDNHFGGFIHDLNMMIIMAMPTIKNGIDKQDIKKSRTFLSVVNGFDIIKFHLPTRMTKPAIRKIDDANVDVIKSVLLSFFDFNL